MFLYNLTLKHSTAIPFACLGNFSGQKHQEIVSLQGNHLILSSINPQNGNLIHISSFFLSGTCKRLIPFKLPGNNFDYLISSSDSGSIVILEYIPPSRCWKRIHSEIFGKAGIRRIVPGEYLAVDPKGRACMIAAVEKQKFVYVLNRDANTPLTISSPLSAHSNNTITFSLIGLDVGYDNPTFASIEVDYTDEIPDKQLVYYELDLGLNHVVRKWSDSIHLDSHSLLALPGGDQGPGGVLIFSPGLITWKHQNYESVEISLPLRRDNQQPRMIISSVMHKMKNLFFCLVQSEDGDLFKLEFDYEITQQGIGGVTMIHSQYFDTIVPSTSILLLKSGFLFAAAEFGNHKVYQIDSLGDDDLQQRYSSIDDTVRELKLRKLKNLILTHDVTSLNPLIKSIVKDSTTEQDEIYTFCGRSNLSSMKILKPGIKVQELAVSELPGSPLRLWTLGKPYHTHIVVTFLNATLVLQIDEEGNVEEMQDSPLLGHGTSLLIQELEIGMIQIHSNGIRHIKGFGMGNKYKVNEWKTPAGKSVIHATANSKQVVVVLNSGEIVYFELDQYSGLLNEFSNRIELENVTCIHIGSISPDRIRFRFLVVGTGDAVVRIFDLDPDNCLQPISMQALNSPPSSICLTQMIIQDDVRLILEIGLMNGLFYRSNLDLNSGILSDVRIRFLGQKSIMLNRVMIEEKEACFALCNKPWIMYSWKDGIKFLPLSYDSLESIANFNTSLLQGFVGISGNQLKIFQLDDLDEMFEVENVDLKYTPRKIHLDSSGLFIILESDCRISTLTQSNDNEEEELQAKEFGYPVGKSNQWKSCIRVMSCQGQTLDLIELENETPLSICNVLFANRQDSGFICIGTVKGFENVGKKLECGFIRLYKLEHGKLIFQHATQVEDIPNAMIAFQGRLLCSIGNLLRIYDLGKKKLLRKCESNVIPNLIVNLHTQGNRIVVADVSESIFFAGYNHESNRIIVFADDFLPRFITISTMLDYDTIACGDKFGNFFVLRLNSDVSEDLDDDPTGNKLSHSRPFLQGASYKLQSICEFHVGDVVTSIQKSSMTLGGKQVIFYTTLQGTLGIFIPFSSKEDVEFFGNLENQMRNHRISPLGRNHVQWRGSFVPVKNVIDGDLCECFLELNNSLKLDVAESLDKTPSDVAKKLEDIRTRNAF